MSKTDSNRVASESKNPNSKTPWLVLLLPLVVIGVIQLVSPNYRTVEGGRSTPLGSDFLHDWVGGKLIGSEESDRLYDWKLVCEMQHDPQLVGFEWTGDEYYPTVYPPFYYAAVSPFSTLNYSVAFKIWAVLSAIAYSISGYLLYRFYPPGKRLLGLLWLVGLAFAPLLHCFNMGQKSTLMLLILTGSFVLLHHRRPFSAGAVFGLMAFKPHLGIVIGLTMLLKRQWWFAAGAVLTVGIQCGVSWLAYPQLWHDYFGVISDMGDYVQTAGYMLFDSHSLWGATQLAFSWLSPLGVKVIAALVSLLVVGLLWRVMRGTVETSSTRFALQFAAMVFATVMLSPHFYTYDLTILLLPMLLIGSSYAPGQWRANPVDQTLGFLLIGIFVLAGLFSQVAELTGIQFSILLMIAVLVSLGLTKSHTETSSQND